jgi:hypothetical protein
MRLALLAVATLAAAASWYDTQRLTDAVGAERLRGDVVWFGEPLRIQRYVDHQLDDELLTARAPLEPLLVRAPLRAWLRLMPATEPIDALRAYAALCAAIWAALMLLTLTMLGCSVVDAVLFTLIGLSSAPAQFWSAVPTTMILASISSMAALIVIARVDARQQASEWRSCAAAVASACVTISNAVFGIALAAVVHGTRRGIQVLVNATCVVLLVSGALGLVYPASGPPRAAPVSASAIALSDVMRLDWLSVIVAVAWVVLLVAGIRQMAAGHYRHLAMFVPVAIVLRLLISALIDEQWMHVALDLLPMLLAVAALGSQSAHRSAVRATALILLICATLHHRAALTTAIEMIGQLR